MNKVKDGAKAVGVLAGWLATMAVVILLITWLSRALGLQTPIECECRCTCGDERKTTETSQDK